MTTAHLFPRDDPARPRIRPARLHFLEVVRGKETVATFSVARQQLDTHASLLERLSLTRVAPRRAMPFPTARSRWFDSRLRVVLQLRALWAAPHGGHAHWLVFAPAPVSTCLRTAPTSPLLLLRPGLFPRSRPSLVLLHPPDLISHPAASCRREELSGRIICQPRFLFPLACHIHTYIHTCSEFHEQLAETGPTSFPSRSGQTPDVVVLPRCHTDVRLPLPLPLRLSNFFSAPARLSQQ